MPDFIDLTDQNLAIGLRVAALLLLYGIIRILHRWRYVYALIWWPSTLAHELSHFLVGLSLGANPVNFSALPRRESKSGRLVLGEVSFTNLRWWNTMPTALAPLVLMPLPGIWLLSTTMDMALLDPQTILIEFAALQCFVGCWPSPTDWLQARAAILVLMGCALLALAAYVYLHAGPF